MSTAIEWTDETWNPTTGCDRVSPGCDHCYAATMAARLKSMGQPKYQTDGDPRTSGPGFGIAEHPDTLGAPLHWRKPRRVFVNSMSDLFHPKVSDEFLARVWAVMAATPQHTYQVLTKRPKRMRTWVGRWSGGAPLPNVWVGTSVGDQTRALQRIPDLVNTPAHVRFLSCEPLLGPVTLTDVIGDDVRPDLDWVIVGGESGHGARPMHPAWARLLRDQCAELDLPFLFKQWGAWAPARFVTGDHFEMAWLADDELVFPSARAGGWEVIRLVGKKAAGRELDGRTWDQFPDKAVAA